MHIKFMQCSPGTWMWIEWVAKIPFCYTRMVEMLMRTGKRVCTPLVDCFERTVTQTIHTICKPYRWVFFGDFLIFITMYCFELHLKVQKWQARIDFGWTKLHSSGSGPLGQRDAHTLVGIWYAQFIHTFCSILVMLLKLDLGRKNKRFCEFKVYLTAAYQSLHQRKHTN